VIALATAPSKLRELLAARGVRARVVELAKPDRASSFPMYEEWDENVQLALATCEIVGVAAETAHKGMSRVAADFGALSAWRVSMGAGKWIAVNGFAANDPDATQRVLRRAIEKWGVGLTPLVGLLNFRRDRGDRTIQWVETLVRDPWPFDRLVVVGYAPWQVRRLLRRTFDQRVTFASTDRPKHVMKTVAPDASREGMVFGFGNIGGIGTKLVEDWQKVGEAL